MNSQFPQSTSDFIYLGNTFFLEDIYFCLCWLIRKTVIISLICDNFFGVKPVSKVAINSLKYKYNQTNSTLIDNKLLLTPTLAGLGLAYAGAWSLWRQLIYNMLFSDHFWISWPIYTQFQFPTKSILPHMVFSLTIRKRASKNINHTFAKKI